MSKYNLFDIEDSNDGEFKNINVDIDVPDDNIDLSVFTVKRSHGNKYDGIKVRIGSPAEKIKNIGEQIFNIEPNTQKGKKYKGEILSKIDSMLHSNNQGTISQSDSIDIQSKLSNWITIKGEITSQMVVPIMIFLQSIPTVC